MPADIIVLEIRSGTPPHDGGMWGGKIIPCPACGTSLRDTAPGNILTGPPGERPRIVCACPQCRWVGFRTLEW